MDQKFIRILPYGEAVFRKVLKHVDILEEPHLNIKKNNYSRFNDKIVIDSFDIKNEEKFKYDTIHIEYNYNYDFFEDIDQQLLEGYINQEEDLRVVTTLLDSISDGNSFNAQHDSLIETINLAFEYLTVGLLGISGCVCDWHMASILARVLNWKLPPLNKSSMFVGEYLGVPIYASLCMAYKEMFVFGDINITGCILASEDWYVDSDKIKKIYRTIGCQIVNNSALLKVQIR